MATPGNREDGDQPWRPEHALLVASAGGHLAQLLDLRPWWRELERTWITQDSPTTRSQLRGERVIPGHFPTTRNVWNLLRNAALAVHVITRVRPDIVVSTGAGVGFPFVLMARVVGIPTVFIEVFDRVESRTLTGALCRPLTSLFVVHWPQQQARYRRSQLIEALWGGGRVPPTEAAGPVESPLLVVTVGTDHHPFDRLINWIDRYRNHLHGDVELRLVCQHGTAQPPRDGRAEPWLDHEELQRLLASATAVVVHGGPYSIIESVRAGRRPIVVPRERRFGEAVDDHQVSFCELLAVGDDVVVVREEQHFRQALDAVLAEPAAFRSPPLGERSWPSSVARFRSLVGGLRPSGRARRRAPRGPERGGSGTASQPAEPVHGRSGPGETR